jgi:hypothetical protein
MDGREAQSLKSELGEICREIGCSGLNGECPGNPACEIIRKIVLSTSPPQ